LFNFFFSSAAPGVVYGDASLQKTNQNPTPSNQYGGSSFQKPNPTPASTQPIQKPQQQPQTPIQRQSAVLVGSQSAPTPSGPPAGKNMNN